MPVEEGGRPVNPAGGAWVKTLAVFSFVAPWLTLGLFVFSLFIPQHSVRLGGVILSGGIALCGLVAGGLALLGSYKYCREGIMGWALTGMGLMLLVLLLLGAAAVTPMSRNQPLSQKKADARYLAEYYTNPTTNEAETFGRQVEAHLAQGDTDFYAQAFDVDFFMQQMFGNLVNGGTADQQKQIRESFNAALRLALLQVEAVKFLRVKTDAGEVRLLLRFTTRNHNKAPAYHELTVKRSKAGRFKIVDDFVYVNGERLVNLVRPEEQSQPQSVLGALTSRFLHPEAFAEASSDLAMHSKMSQDLEAGQAATALADYHRLSKSFQHRKYVQLERLTAALKSDEPEYLEAAQFFSQQYPNDPALVFISIEHDWLHKNYDALLADLDKLDSLVGGDPYLDELRAEAFAAMTPPRLADAEKCLRRALDREPTLCSAGLLLIAQLNQGRQYDECVAVLEQLRTQGDLKKDTLNRSLLKSPQVRSGLVSSPAYENWLNGTGAAVAVSTPLLNLKLQAIFFKTGNPSATINNQLVKVGSKIDDWEVVAIAKDIVTLKSSAGAQRFLTM
jgi:hypothetical protein